MVWRIEAENHPKAGMEPLPETLFNNISIEVIDDYRDIGLNAVGLVFLDVLRPGYVRRLPRKEQRVIQQLREQHLHPLEPSPADVYRQALPELREHVEGILRLGSGR